MDGIRLEAVRGIELQGIDSRVGDSTVGSYRDRFEEAVIAGTAIGYSVDISRDMDDIRLEAIGSIELQGIDNRAGDIAVRCYRYCF